MLEEISRHLAVVVGIVPQGFRRRAIAEIVVAGQACRSCQMWIARPRGVVVGRVLVGLCEPSLILAASTRSLVIYGQYHRSYEGRLRTSQVIRAVRVEHCAVMLDLEEEILNHPLREINLSIP